MSGWQTISQFTWDRQDVLRACDGNKAATQVLEYLLYLLKLRAKDNKADDPKSDVYWFSYPISYLAKKTVFSERTVRRGIKLLSDKGLVVVSHPNGFNRTASYQVNLERVDAWFNEKMPLFPVNYPSHANDDRPCGQVGHIEAAKMATSMRPSWPHRSGQDDRFILDPYSPKIEPEEAEQSSSAEIEVLAEKAGISDGQASVVLRTSPPQDLLNAAVDCWRDRLATIKDKTRENPVRFLRACLRSPGEFGILKGTDGWYFPGPVVMKDLPNASTVKEAAARIKQHRLSGDSDRYAVSLLRGRYKHADLAKAFEEVGGYRD